MIRDLQISLRTLEPVESSMSFKSTTAISSLLFFLAINSQIVKAQHLNSLPDLNSIPDPSVFLQDTEPIGDSSRQIEEEFSESESKLYLCVPIGLGLYEPNKREPDNSQENSDECILYDSDSFKRE